MSRSMISATPAPWDAAVTKCAISFSDGNALLTATAQPQSFRKA